MRAACFQKTVSSPRRQPTNLRLGKAEGPKGPLVEALVSFCGRVSATRKSLRGRAFSRLGGCWSHAPDLCRSGAVSESNNHGLARSHWPRPCFTIGLPYRYRSPASTSTVPLQPPAIQVLQPHPPASLPPTIVCCELRAGTCHPHHKHPGLLNFASFTWASLLCTTTFALS